MTIRLESSLSVRHHRLYSGNPAVPRLSISLLSGECFKPNVLALIIINTPKSAAKLQHFLARFYCYYCSSNNSLIIM